ncbi:MAG: AhpC/TSA family protein, partial [Bacteroidetes bacterium]|nr:AhpC/TSA family protein [Bacteroidota bacterium]
MKKLNYFFQILIIVLIAGCAGKKADENSFVIHGKFVNTKMDSIYIEELTTTNTKVIDSAVVSEDGEFYFKVKPKETGFYILKLNANNFVTLLIEKGENLEITADSRQMLKTYTVSGSKGSELIRELNMHVKNNYDKVDSLSKIFNESQKDPNFIKIKESLDSTYRLIFADQKNFAAAFIDKNTSSLACLIAIYQQFGREQLFNPNNKNDFAYFEKLDKALNLAYPENIHFQDLHKRVAEIKKIEAEKQLAEVKLSIGSKAPDFTLKTPEGTSVSLSSFNGKYLLIDFWASWCAPCRQENPNMVKLYKKYKDKNFTILGVSLDRDNESWTKAIKLDKLIWTQVSDL